MHCEITSMIFLSSKFSLNTLVLLKKSWNNFTCLVIQIVLSCDMACFHRHFIFFSLPLCTGINSLLIYSADSEIRGITYNPNNSTQALPFISQIQKATVIDFHAGEG